MWSASITGASSSRRSPFSPSFSNDSHHHDQSINVDAYANVGVLWIRPDWIDERFTKVLVVADNTGSRYSTTNASAMKTVADIVYQYLTESLRSELWYSLLHRHTTGDQVLVLSFGKYKIYAALDPPRENGRRIMVLHDASLEETLKDWMAKPQKVLQICLVDADDMEAEWPWNDSVFHHVSSCSSRPSKVILKIVMNGPPSFLTPAVSTSECVALLSVPYYHQQPYNAYAASNLARKQHSTLQITSRKRIRFEQPDSDDSSRDINDFHVDPTPATKRRRRRHSSLSHKFRARRTATVAMPKEDEISTDTDEEEDCPTERNHIATQTDMDVLWNVDGNTVMHDSEPTQPGADNLALESIKDQRNLKSIEQTGEQDRRAISESNKLTALETAARSKIEYSLHRSDDQHTSTAIEAIKESMVKETEGPTKEGTIKMPPPAAGIDEEGVERPLLAEAKRSAHDKGESKKDEKKLLDQLAQVPTRDTDDVSMEVADASNTNKQRYSSTKETSNPITQPKNLPKRDDSLNDNMADAAPHMVSQELDNIPTDGDSTSSDDSSSSSENEKISAESITNGKLIGTVSTDRNDKITDCGPQKQQSRPTESSSETNVANIANIPAEISVDSMVQPNGKQQRAQNSGEPVMSTEVQPTVTESQLRLSVDGYLSVSSSDHGQVILSGTPTTAPPEKEKGTAETQVNNSKASSTEQASSPERGEQSSLVKQQPCTFTEPDTNVLLDKEKLHEATSEPPTKMQTMVRPSFKPPPLLAAIPHLSGKDPATRKPTETSDEDTSDDDSSTGSSSSGNSSSGSSSSSSSSSSSDSDKTEGNTTTAKQGERKVRVDQEAQQRATAAVVSQNETGDFPVAGEPGNDDSSTSSAGSSSPSLDSSSSSSSSIEPKNRQLTKIVRKGDTSQQNKKVTSNSVKRKPLLDPDRKISFV